MTPERWKQIDELAQSALEREGDERAAFLDEACAVDDLLRREVESQIAYQQQASKFLEDPAFKHAAELMADPQVETESMEGQTISHYRILRKLGAGGMGEVYLAKDTTLDRKVAIKFLSQNSTAGEQARRRLVREARAAAALDHPNICAVYEVGEEAGYSFIVMQYVEGETLASRLERKPLEVGEALEIAVKIADALAEAHAHNIIHRDIKPANIMMTTRRQVKVMDFGLAKAIAQREFMDSQAPTETLLSEPGMILGTVPYMSPEQVRGESVDARSDIFSFGIMLYEMASGHKPFAAESAAATISAILTRAAAPLARYLREVPGELERIVSKALRKDREERYQVIKDMALDLRSLKEELEFEAKLERSAPPEFRSEAGAQSQQAAVAAPTGPLARSTLSAEYLISGIKQHKRGAALALTALAVAVAATAYFYSLRSGPAMINSMAVLPFVNASDDPDTEYLSDGITESLINSLSLLPNLRMIARTSAQRYKGRETDPQTVARELGVRAVLTGRVVRRGDSLSISAELVDARDNSHIWGEQYNRRLSDILVMQQEIAREIAERLRARLTGEERRRVTRNYTENVEAYQLYLRGRHHWNKRTGEGLRQAIEYFQQAIERDPNYALAYSGLADCYSNLERYANAPPSEGQPRARAAALRALEIDASLAEAHASLGFVYYQSWQWVEAERELKRAIELNPNYASAHQWYGLWLDVMGRFDEAVGEGRRAQELDPLSLVLNVNLAVYSFRKGDLDATINQCRKVIELSPNSADPHIILAHVYQKQGRHEEAIAEFQKAAELSGRPASYAPLGYGYAVAGRRSEALAILREVENRYVRREARGAQIAWIYAGLGDKDQAFAWLERDFQARSGVLAGSMIFNTYLDTLRGDPRYAELLRRMGLPY